MRIQIFFQHNHGKRKLAGNQLIYHESSRFRGLLKKGVWYFSSAVVRGNAVTTELLKARFQVAEVVLDRWPASGDATQFRRRDATDRMGDYEEAEEIQRHVDQLAVCPLDQFGGSSRRVAFAAEIELDIIVDHLEE